MMRSYEIDFEQIFKTNYEYKFFAPGRINLVGDHIDYNGGHVLPIAINLGIYALVSEREDRDFYVFNDNNYEQGKVKISLDNLTINRKDGFANYPKAIIITLIEKGFTFDHGLNIYFYQTLPEQNGLSRSAALEILTVNLLNEIYKLGMTPLELSVLARKAVTDHLDYTSGIMDQAAISLAKENNALYLDTNYLKCEYIPYNLGDYSIVVCQTNVIIANTYALYKQRVRECERALDIIKNNFNVRTLCQIPGKYLEMIKNILPDEKLYRRVMHVYTEEKRVNLAKEALLNNDIEAFAKCINESHVSLRDNFEVSSKELNTIVDLARAEQGCLAARMTGAGFGGCALALVHNDFLVEFKKHMSKNYKAATGLTGAFFEVYACGGPKRLAKDIYSIDDSIESLIQYAIDEYLIEEDDRIYMVNQVLALLGKTSLEEASAHPEPLYMILDNILNYAVKNGIIENNEQARDAFDTKLMGMFVKRPSEVITTFRELAKKDINSALSYYHHLAISSNYIRVNRMDKNVNFDTLTDYGKLKVTINISRVESRPQFVLANKSSYPECLLCKEAVGFAGNEYYPAKQNHRTIPLTINGDTWFFQYSPYPYFAEHSILLNKVHTPLHISRHTFETMVGFVDIVPDYFIGTNADLPIIGGGILNHEHYHTGRFRFPVEDAKELMSWTNDNVKLSILNWPVSVIRLETKDKDKLIDEATHIYDVWSNYNDLAANIIAFDEQPHNSVTPILRKKGEMYQLDIFLRNNRTSEKYPLGIFHPHAEYLHIKKENIGLFELMGLAVLPKTLKEEMYLLKDMLVKGETNFNYSLLKHREWALMLQSKYKFTRGNVTEIVHKEIGYVVIKMLEDCAVFKNDEDGIERFKDFIKQLS